MPIHFPRCCLFSMNHALVQPGANDAQCAPREPAQREIHALACPQHVALFHDAVFVAIGRDADADLWHHGFEKTIV